MSKKDLIARWKSTAENDRASERIFHTFKYGGVLSMDQSPFGRLESDLVDFRGYPGHRVLVREVVFKDIDLSYADLSNCWLAVNRFDSCLFEKTDFTNSSEHGDTFDHCVFRNCKFRRAIFGYDGSQFRNCTFQDCNIQRMDFIRAEFTNTNFINCRLRNVEFNASSFENCTFDGVLDDVWFRGTFPLKSLAEQFGQPKPNKMEHVSFENADLIDLTISDGCDLSTVKVKNNGRYFKFDNWLNRLKALEKEIATWENEHHKKEAHKFVKVSMVHAQKQDWEILNLDDVEKHYGGVVTAEKILDALKCY